MGVLSRLTRRTLRRVGVDVRRIDKSALSKDGEYDLVLPRATYSPWNTDRPFKDLYSVVQDLTLVDEARCFELWKLVEQSAKLETGSCIEIGVWRGGTGAIIAKQAMNCGLTDRVHLCDTFAGVVKAGPNDSSYKGGEHSDTARLDVERLLKRVQLDNVQLHEGVFPDQTGRELDHLQFRFCHIDVDVYQSAKDIVDWIWARMVRGGIIVYDDYGFKCCDGIRRHVEEQSSAADRLIIHNLNGHGIVLKL
jgi:O-methyltransferase